MRFITAILFVVMVALALPGVAVEPAYSGPLGNVEEPALRPYKWLYRGVKSLVYHTGDQLIDGNMRTPVAGSVQGFRGLRRGTVELGESLYRGGVFAPVPPPNDYKKLGRANSIIERDILLRNSSDLLFSWYFFPGQKIVDHHPIEGDVKVDIRKEEARQIRASRNAATASRNMDDPNESDTKRAQRKYIGDRADYGTGRKDEYRGNLMKLAR